MESRHEESRAGVSPRRDRDETRPYRWAPAPAQAGRAPLAHLVLVVEPHEDSRSVMRVVFEDACGFAVAECEGERVIEECERLNPALIILAERLPRVDGRTVCRSLREAAEHIRHTPVIFTSTSSTQSSERLAFEAGCTLYFVKPFDIVSLMTAAMELVRS
jgi:CheY-like chemotaxis protein